MQDEPELIKITNPHLKYFDSYEKSDSYKNIGSYVKSYLNHGRFHPLMVATQWIIAKISDSNPFIIRLYVFLVTTIVITLFFVYLRLLSVPLLLAVLFAGTFFAGRYDEIWWRYGASELVGLLFLLITLIAFTIAVTKNNNKWHILAFASMILASLYKESFWILIPVISLIYLLTYAWKNNIDYITALRKTKNIHITTGIIFIILTAGIISIVLFTNYSVVKEVTFSRWTIFLTNLKSMIQPFALWIPIVLLIIISFFIKTKQKIRNKYSLGLLIVLCLWIATQLIVHKNVPVDGSVRYLMPAQFALLVVSALSIKTFKELKLNKLYYLFLIVFSLYFLQNLKNVYINSSYFGNRAIAYNKMLDKINELNPKGIAIINDTDESIYATATYLSYRGTNVPVKWLKSEGEGGIYEQFFNSLPNRKSSFQMIDFTQLINDKTIDMVVLGSPAEYSNCTIDEYKDYFPQTFTITQSFTNIATRTLLSGRWEKTFTQNNTITYIILKK